MRNFLQAGKLLLLDMASTILFLVVFLLTHNIPLAIGLGIALGLAQIGSQFARRKPIETMEWLSLFLVVASGTATLLTDNPRFVNVQAKCDLSHRRRRDAQARVDESLFAFDR
jgi:intracellular septation protein